MMSDQQNNHLSRLQIEGFKSIQKLDLEMRPINILIGANGAGKSNLISLFTFLRNLSEGKLQNYVEKNGFANAFFYFGSKQTPSIKIGVDVGDNGYHVEFEHGVFDDTLVFKTEYCTFVGSSKLYHVKSSRGESGLLPDRHATSPPVRDYTRKYMEECRVYHFHDTGATAGFKQASDGYSGDYLYSNASNIATFLYRLKNSKEISFIKSYQAIVEAIKTVSPYFHDFFLEPRGSEGEEKVLLKWIHRDQDDPFSAQQLSDGTARFICMATLFLQPKDLRPELIILDEPELGLHPAALEVLADIIKSISKETQVICSTQSVTFANHFTAQDFIVVDQHQGASDFKRVDEDQLKQWLDDYAMGEIWSKNLIGGRPEW
jgi:predicted ATPase